MRLILIILPLVLALVTIDVRAEDDPKRGGELYAPCAACHGAQGEGNDAIAEAYGVEMPPLYSKQIQSQDDASLKKVIVEGKGKMSWSVLSGLVTSTLLAGGTLPSLAVPSDSSGRAPPQ